MTFENERDFQYFCHFRDVTAVEFSSGFETTLWTTLVLKACDNSSICRLTIATAALSIAVRAPLNSTRDVASDLHLQYALQQYGLALNEIVAARKESTRVALISALLIFCFESLQGDLGRAVVHIQSAVEMVIKKLSSTARPHYFSRIGLVGSPQCDLSTNELLMAFMRLDRLALALTSRQCGVTPRKANRIFMILFSAEELEVPDEFATVSEARVYLEDISWRAVGSGEAPGSLSMLLDGIQGKSNTPDIKSIPRQFKQWYHASNFPSTDARSSCRLAQWHDAFSSILNAAAYPPCQSMFIPAAILHVQALVHDLVVTGFMPASPSVSRADSLSSTRSSSLSDHRGSSMNVSSSLAPGRPDWLLRRMSSSEQSTLVVAPSCESSNQFPTIHAVLTFCRRLVADPCFLKSFVFDLGVIYGLTFIAMLCPDRMLGKEAAVVLRSMVPRREGLWDSGVCADAVDQYIQTEESQSGWDVIDPFLIAGGH